MTSLNLARYAIFNKLSDRRAMDRNSVSLEAVWVIHIGFIRVCVVAVDDVRAYIEREQEEDVRIIPYREVGHTESASRPLIVMSKAMWEK